MDKFDKKYVYRTRLNATLQNNLSDGLNELASLSRVPKTRLVDEAVELLLEKHGIKTGYNYRKGDK